MVRVWLKVTWASIGVAVVSAAAQLGIAEALGIIRWTGAQEAADARNDWNTLLTWVGFSFAVAVLAGAAAGRRERGRGRPDSVGVRIAAALAAAMGGAAAVSLAWLLAREANPPVSGDPQLVVAITAGAGVLAGLLIALLALSAPAIAAGVRASAGWVWLAGVASAVAGLATHRPYDPPRLAVIDAPSIVPAAWWAGPYLMVVISALLGFAVAGMARWRGARRYGSTLAGLAGPAVVAAAYLIAGPGTDGEGTRQLEPYQASLIAAGVGLLAAGLVALPRSPQSRNRPAPAAPTLETSAAVPAGSAKRFEPGEYGQPSYHAWPTQDDTSERPLINAAAAAAPAVAVMGQPPRTPSDDYSEWIRDLGQFSSRSREPRD